MGGLSVGILYANTQLTYDSATLAAITVDGTIDADLRRRLLASHDVRSVTVLTFADSDRDVDDGAGGAA